MRKSFWKRALYKEFNKLVHDYICEENDVGNYFIFKMDKCLIEHMVKDLGTTEEKLLDSIRKYLENDWGKLLIPNDDKIPQYLGLIALQLYAAHLRQGKIGKYTAKAYLPHLNKLLGFTGNYQIEKLFKKYQVTIWEKLKKWLDGKGFYLNLPPQKSGKGMYVQYPLSQALLNRNDLEKLPLLFKNAGISPYEEFSLEDFIELVFPVKDGIVTDNFNTLYDEKEYQSTIQQQVFNFYQTWDGSCSDPDLEKKSSKETGKLRAIPRETGELILERTPGNDNGSFDIYIVDEHDNKVKDLDLLDKNLLTTISTSIYLYYKDKIVFVPDEDYDNCWLSARYLKPNVCCYILLDKNSENNGELIGQIKEYTKNDESNEFFNLFQVKITNPQDVPYPLNKIIRKCEKKYSMQNGLKLGRKIWMQGGGPDIVLKNEQKKIWINGQPYEEKEKISCRDFSIGEHTVKVKDFTPEKFFIEAPIEKKVDMAKGWRISVQPPLWQGASEKPVIRGLTANIIDDNKDVSIVRQWQEAVLGRGEKKQDDSLPTVINAIRRKNYGVR